jgi:acyl dehydratase
VTTADFVQPRWADVEVGRLLPAVQLDVTTRRVVLTPAFTIDPFPGHFDVDYARALGHPTIFMNTMSLLGLIDRLVTDWAGEHAFIVEHSISLKMPVYVGTQVTVRGSVASKGVVDNRGASLRVVTVDVAITADDALCTTGQVTVMID